MAESYARHLTEADVTRFRQRGWSDAQILAISAADLQRFMADDNEVPPPPAPGLGQDVGAPRPSRATSGMAGPTWGDWIVPVTPEGINWRAVVVLGVGFLVVRRLWRGR